MRSNRFSSLSVIGAIALSGAMPTLTHAQQSNTPTIYASGLQGPRGLRFDLDGDLYVAESGTGGTQSTVGICTQVPGPPAGPGPWTGGLTARISKSSPNGNRTTVASGFPSTTGLGGTIGVTDGAFLNDTLYALIGGGGCSHGNPHHPSGIAEVNRSTGKWTMIADIGAWLKTHRAAFVSADDFEPDGTLYSMISVYGGLYAVEPNHGQVISVTPDGKITETIDISASEGHIVPTSIAHRRDSRFRQSRTSLAVWQNPRGRNWANASNGHDVWARS